jgi:cytochrome P450
LAKLELGIAFETLLRRAPRLDLIEPPRWKPTFVLRGLESLRVRI